jgi:hypothetical protein
LKSGRPRGPIAPVVDSRQRHRHLAASQKRLFEKFFPRRKRAHHRHGRHRPGTLSGPPHRRTAGGRRRL